MPLPEPVTRDRILDEAARLFVERGYNGISMREIAEGVGITKAGLYYHFVDKESLFLSILTNNLDKIWRLVLSAQQEGGTVRAQIQFLVRGILDWPPDQRAVIRLARQEATHLSQQSRDDFMRLYHEKFTGQIEALLRDGIQRGELRAFNVRQAAWMLLGMIYPFLDPGNQRELGSPDDTLALLTTIFFDGCANYSIKGDEPLSK